MTQSGTTTLGPSGPESNGSYWSFTIRLFNVISGIFIYGEGSYPATEMQLLYSTSPAHWAEACS